MFASKDIFLKSSGAGGYQISRSVRLRSSATAYLNRTPASATNRQIWTWSAWTKLGSKIGAADACMFNGGATSNDRTAVAFASNDRLHVYNATGGSINAQLISTAKYRDPSAWYHIVVAVDTTQATSSNRIKIYVNGVQVTAFDVATYPSQNLNTSVNNNVSHTINTNPSNEYWDGYLTEINFIDGQALTPSSFGETNAITGVWQPKRYAGTYGTNGFYLNFSDNSAATATTIGKDNSGNGNNWTPNNISVTAGVTYDSFTDVPTPYADGGTGRGNYAVGNPLAVNVTTSATATLTNGNLLLTNGSATYSGFPSTMSIPVTGKWAWKFKVTGSVSGSNDGNIGFACNSSGNPVTGASSGAAANWFTTVQVQAVSDRGVVHKYAGGSVVTDAAGSGGTGATGDEWEFLIDRDAGTTIVKINGTTKATVTGLPATQELFPFATFYQTSGYFIFDYTPSDTSYKTLNTQNLPTPTISNGASYMAATLYTGNGGSQSIANTVNGISFQPDFVWVKKRSGAENHELTDAVRGNNLRLASNTTDAESAGGIAMASTGFALSGGFGTDNENAATYVGWQWNAGGSTVTNTSGSISAQVRANATAGFSVVTWTGAGSAGTIGHGLGVTPSMIIIKNRSGTQFWFVNHTSISTTQNLYLNDTASVQSDGIFTSRGSTTFGVGAGVAASSTNYVAYCFAAVAGYSAFGKYTGNGSADGPFVFLGFRPRFVIIRRTDAGNNWHSYTSTIDPSNVVAKTLYPNTSGTEGTENDLDFVSNGMKMRDTGTHTNASGGTYIYMAWAENPFQNSLAR